MWRTDFRGEIATGKGADSFSVCCMARETLPIVQKFVDHYRRAGARQIHLFLDGTDEETQEIREVYKADDFVEVTCCNPDFWRRIYPDDADLNLSHKLVGAFKLGIQKNTSDWILFCDADEFVVGDTPLGAALAMLPKDCLGIRLRNTEAVWGADENIDEPYSCGFERSPFTGGQRRKAVLSMLIYGKEWQHMRRGTAGHVAGKHLLRKGVMPDRMKSHYSWLNGKKIDFLHTLVEYDANLRVVHFDAISHLLWQEKWKSRLEGYTNFQDLGKARVLQMEKVKSALADGTDEKLFRRYYGLNRWQQFFLKRLGLLTRIDK